MYRPIPDWRPTTQQISADDLPLLTAIHPAIAVHFWAIWNGCDPPFDRNIQEVASQFAGRLHFVSCDIDRPENQPLCERCRIANVPTVAVFKKDQFLGRIVGLRDTDELVNQIEKLLTDQPLLSPSKWRFLRRVWPFHSVAKISI